jgi:hypothetical protein
MVASLSSLGLRGFTAISVISALRRQFPKAANFITSAQIAGYSASQILHALDKNKKDKNYDPDEYLTEYEKGRKILSKQKRDAALTAMGVLGTAGAVAAGVGYLATRGPRTTLLPATPQQQQPRGVGYQPLLALPHNQTPQTAQGPMQGPRGPNQWVQGTPQQQATQAVQPPTQVPSNPIVQQSQQQPQQMQQPVQRTPEQIMKSVALVNNLQQQTRMANIVKSGHDNEISATIARNVFPKEVVKTLDKIEGGIEQIVDDYKQYMTQQSQQQQMQQEQTPVEQMQPQQQMEQQLPVEQPVETNTPVKPPSITSNTPPKPSSITPNTVVTPHGVGEVVHKGKAGSIVEVNGKKKSYKPDDVIKPFDDVEEAVRHVIKSIPENLKSTAIQSTIFLPTGNKEGVMVTKFYDGKVAWYKDVSRDLYRSIALGQYEPKTKGKTGIAQYEPGVIDSRGAGFSSEISRNKKYSKETEGDMWGYGESMYDLFDDVQQLINKISKEKYDDEGNLIQPKRKKK